VAGVNVLGEMLGCEVIGAYVGEMKAGFAVGISIGAKVSASSVGVCDLGLCVVGVKVARVGEADGAEDGIVVSLLDGLVVGSAVGDTEDREEGLTEG